MRPCETQDVEEFLDWVALRYDPDTKNHCIKRIRALAVDQEFDPFDLAWKGFCEIHPEQFELMHVTGEDKLCSRLPYRP